MYISNASFVDVYTLAEEYIKGLELKRTISTLLKKWAKCTSVKQPYFACKKPLHPISS